MTFTKKDILLGKRLWLAMNALRNLCNRLRFLPYFVMTDKVAASGRVTNHLNLRWLHVFISDAFTMNPQYYHPYRRYHGSFVIGIFGKNISFHV